MEQNIPLWLNKNFLTAIIQKKEGDYDKKLSVTTFSARSAIFGGNNFSSHIFRVLVEYETENPSLKGTTSLILKMPVNRGLLNAISNEINLFRKEQTMYHTLLPILCEKVNCEFSPSTYCCLLENCLVLDDLIHDGYIMYDESKQLDFHHCKKVVETIAKFHAGSVVCFHENPGLIKAVGEDSLWAKGCLLKPWVRSAVKTMIGIVSVMDGCEVFTNFLISRVDHLWESIVNMSKPKVEGLNVLNHGDLWTHNMLFKHSDFGDFEVEDVKFVDFQISKLATPVLDLINFVWTSANEEVRERSQPDLYFIYLKTLNATLEQLGIEERYSREELREDLKSTTDWAVLMICCALPVIMSPPEDALNLGNFSSEDFGTYKFTNIYKGRRFRSLLPNVIKQFTEFFLSEIPVV